MVHYYVVRNILNKEASDWFNEQLYNLITEELDDFTLANSIEENFRENGFPNNLDAKLIEAIDELSKVIGEIKVELMNARR